MLAGSDLLAADAATLSGAWAPVTPEEAFALDDEMRAFVADQIGDAKAAITKLNRLVRGMQEHGLLSLEYSNDETRTVHATFHERRGNCLSFTMLFVALAREAGLDVNYQIVDVPPTWSNDSGILVVNTHINTRISMPFGRDYTVDFNQSGFNEKYNTHVVTDSYALALFYNNLGAEALIRGDYDLSFRSFRAAIAADPKMSDGWTNLGVLYSRQQRYQLAEAAYQQALASNPRTGTVLTNLVNLHTMLGNDDFAESYRQRVRRYQEKNPYYHYAVAQQAFEDGDFEQALADVRKALKLKADDGEFYLLQGLTYLELGESREAQVSLARATSYGSTAEIGAEYGARLEAPAEAQ
jgi:Flp pilus assembly protein TadD